jgi:hypothetical protein
MDTKTIEILERNISYGLQFVERHFEEGLGI